MNRLTLFVPCLNEEESIPQLKDKLADLYSWVDFIFVNDGSTDKTLECLKSHFSQLPNSTIVSNEKSMNLGGIFKKYLNLVKTPYVGMIDADCSYDPKMMVPMMKRIDEGFDFVDGSANHPGGRFAGKTPLYRKVFSKGVVFLYNFIMFKRMHCYTSMFRIYKTEDLRSILITKDGFMVLSEIKTKLLMANKTCFEFPTDSTFRKFGVSKARIFKNIKDHLQYMMELIIYRIKN